MSELDDVRKGHALLKEAVKFMANGFDYQFEKLMACHDKLMRVSPIQAGDTVALTLTPVINEQASWGWMGGKHYLVKGERAKVAWFEIGHDGEYRYYLHFENETWINSLTGEKNKPDKHAAYGFGEDAIVKVKP